jgi:hypothetical protein
MFFQPEFGSPVCLVLKMRRIRSSGKSGNPITSTDGCVPMQMNAVKVYAKRQMTNRAIRFENKLLRKHPRDADATGLINRKAETSYQKSPTNRPWQQHQQRSEQQLHDAATSSR